MFARFWPDTRRFPRADDDQPGDHRGRSRTVRGEHLAIRGSGRRRAHPGRLRSAFRGRRPLPRLTVVRGHGHVGRRILSAWVSEKFVLDLRVDCSLIWSLFHRIFRAAASSATLCPDWPATSATIEGWSERREHGSDLFLPDRVLRPGCCSTELAAGAGRAGRRAGFWLARFLPPHQGRRAGAAPRYGSIGAVAEESLGNAALVQAYDREPPRPTASAARTRGASRAQMVATRLEALFGPVATSSSSSGCCLIGFAHLRAGRRAADPRRAAGLRRLPEPALRPGRRLRRAREPDVRGGRGRRADHRGARRGAGRAPTRRTRSRWAGRAARCACERVTSPTRGPSDRPVGRPDAADPARASRSPSSAPAAPARRP